MLTDEVVTSQGTPQHGRQLNRWRLGVIGAVVALAAGIGAVLGFSLVGERTGALGTAASYLPADTVMYGEVQLDLSPGQAASLHAILERFPAADADLVPLNAIADAVDQGLGASGSGLTYAKDIGPWFDGRVSFAMLDYPVGSTDAARATLPDMAALLGVKDPAAARAFSDKVRDLAGKSGTSLTSSEHAGVTIWSAEGDVQLAANTGFAYAVTADELVLANGRTTIESMLDAHGASQNLGARQELDELIGHLPADRVGFFAVDTRQMVEELRTQVEQKDPSLAALLDRYVANIPPFAVSSLSLQPDALAFDGASTLPGGDLAPTNSRRDLASRVPSDTLFFADGGKLGSSLAQFVTGVKAGLAAQSGGDQASTQLEQVEAAMGANAEDFVSWIGDGALAVGATGGTPWGGLVLEANDAAVATQRLNQLRSLVELGAQASGQQVAVTTETVGGVEVTTIRAATGASGDAAPAMPEIVAQYAMKDDTVFIGFGDGFVARSLGLNSADSLARSDRFNAAVARFGGDDNAGMAFVDLAGIRAAVEAAAGQMLPSEYEGQVKPNVEPLDYLVYLTKVEGDVVVTRGGLVLK
ncbi:MAG TPA: DUF3352 domain-containing protein [Candidatus Limnocylindria bacterium]